MTAKQQQQEAAAIAIAVAENDCYYSPGDAKDDANNNVVLLDLLQISQFLTVYQSFYTFHSNTIGPILLEDLQNVLHYRALKRNLQHWKEQASIYDVFHLQENQKGGESTSSSELVPENPFQARINECLEKLAVYHRLPKKKTAAAATATARQQQEEDDDNDDDAKYDRIVKIDKLWRRMQVWTCKALAQHVLVVANATHDNNNNKNIPNNNAAAPSPRNNNNLQTQHHLWSYPLSLPLSSYSMSLLPLVKDNIKERKELLPFAKLFDKTYNNDNSQSKSTTNNSNISNIMPNCLLVPPNHYNCREYTRLCSMMAQLPNNRARLAAHVSPLTLNARCSSSIQTSSSTGTGCCQVKFQWQAPHLVALWIRAQRSPQALRHLIQLFHVVLVVTTPAAALLDNNNDNKNYDDDTCNQRVSRHDYFRAEFQGNHKLVYKRSVLCSHLADKISTWAIVNQVQCTYPLFVKHWQQQVSEQRVKLQLAATADTKNNKRLRQASFVNQHQRNNNNNKRKRRKTSSYTIEETALLQDDIQTTELHRDCQAFILRTWARRHGKALHLLYQHPWQVPQDDEQTSTTRPQQQQLLVSMETLKAHLKKELPRTWDRTLLRIERRIGTGKYSVEKSFQHAVINLLKAFRHCLFKEKERRRQSRKNDENSGGGSDEDDDDDNELNATVAHLQQAQDDFERTCTEFDTVWNEAGAIAAARSLFAWTNEALFTMPSSTIATTIPAGKTERVILSSAPAPWLNICCNCNAAVKEEGSYRTCACCGQVCHISCCTKEDPDCQTPPQKGLKSYISAFAPLRELFLVKAPSSSQNPNFHLPDYTGDQASEITWTMTRVHLTRTHKTTTLDAAAGTAAAPESPLPLSSRRQLEDWGLVFFETQHGQERMDEVLEGNLPLWKWKKTWGPPLSIPHVGLIVSKIVDNSPSARSSVQVGDVIVAVRVGESDVDSTTAEDEKFCPKQMHTLANLKNREEYRLLFKQGSKELDLVIQRPSRPILEEANTCLNDLVQAMEIPQAVLDDDAKSGLLHFCPSCRCETTNSTTAKRSVRDTIRNCKAVIRRLGSEWYGPYFWYENHVRTAHVLSLDVDSEEDSSINEKNKLGEVHVQSVSLGRLDQMMEELLDREEEEDQVMDEDASMAFFVGNHRLDWAPPDLEKSPLTLLCRGINLLLNDYKKSSGFQDAPGQTLLPTMEMRKALAADFVRLFSCWCLVLPAETHISLKGPYPHALFAAVPATMGRCCSSCRVRQLPSDGDVVSTTCDVCQSLANVQSTSTSDNEPHRLPQIDLQIQQYQEKACLVGCSILLLPGDPLLKVTANALSADNITIEHCDRPFEFLVVSYLPSSLKECIEEEDAGVFHLLPIVNTLQMKYLLQRCKFRQPDKDGRLKDETIQRWRKDGLLDLVGVLQLSFKELTSKVNATARIIDSVSNEVARLARCTCDQSMAQLERCFDEVAGHDKENDYEKVIPCSNPRCCASAELDVERSFPWQHTTTTSDTISTPLLIDAALHTRSPVMVDMVNSKVASNPDSDMPVDEQVDPSTLKPTAEEMTLFRKDPGKTFFSHPGGSIRVCYSDLYFNSLAEMLRFEKSASGLESQNPQHTDKMTVVLSNLIETSGSFDNIWGWGFELIYWQTHRCIRVGRIHRDGPAFASGLRSGDTLVSINGRNIAHVGTFYELVCAILSVSHTMFFPHDSLLRMILHWISTQQRPLGPVIFEILRASPRPRDVETTCTEPQNSTQAFVPPQTLRRPSAPQQALAAPLPIYHLPRTHQQSIPAPRWPAESHPQPPQQQVLHQAPRMGNFSTGSYGSSRDWSRSQENRDTQQHGRAPIHEPMLQHRPQPVVHHPIPPPVHPPNAAPPRTGQKYRDIDFPWITESFRNIKPYLSQCATYLSVGDLHLSFFVSVLTVAETSVLMMAIAQDQPMLGFRLLSPRYSVRTLVWCLQLLTRANFLGYLRKLPAGFWDVLLTKDFDRSAMENKYAPFVFVDSFIDSGDVRYEYRMPTHAFPIDQFFVEFLRHRAPIQFQAPAGPGFSFEAPVQMQALIGPGRVDETIDLTGDDNTERIRGGGGGNTEEVSQKHLIDLPQSEWHDTLVKGKCATERGEDNNSSHTRFIGRVKFPNGSCSADGKVDVCVFHLKSMGPINPHFNIKYHPRKLKVIDEMSNDAIKALNAEKMKREPTSASDPYMAYIDPLNDHEMLGMSESLKLPATVRRTEEKPVRSEQEEAPKLSGTMLSDEVRLGNIATAAGKPVGTEKEQHLLESDAVVTVEYINQEEANFKPTAALTHPTQDIKADGNELVGRLCDSQTLSTCPLGFLPDGRPLYWFRGDPHAVFISSSSPMLQDDPISELALTQATHNYEKRVRENFDQHRGSLFCLRPSQPGTYSCFWGCTVFSEDGVGSCRSFESMSELRDHLRIHHSYIQEDATPGLDLVRVDDPALLTGVCCGLAAAACAKCSPLRIFAQTTTPSNEQVVFSGDRLFSKQARKQVIESMADQDEFDSSTMRLYLRLARLFQVNGEEAYGLSKDEMLHAITLCHGQCDGRDGQNDASVEDPGCCSLGCERVLVTENDEYRDTGCLPIGDICLDETDAYPTDCGDVSITDAKSMLLALAANIPESIRKMKSKCKVSVHNNIAVNDVFPQMQLWSDEGFDSWKRFVLGSQDVRCVGQAFVALVFSLNIDLPEWWESEGIGWSPLQASHSISSLLYHLQVFEAALMECIAVTSAVTSMPFKDANQHIPQNLISFTYDRQVSVTLERAKEIGLDRFKGEYNSFCSICQDGGDVLCCELCANVGHASCYKLTDADVNDFVCYACMTDVATMYPAEVVGEELDL